MTQTAETTNGTFQRLMALTWEGAPNPRAMVRLMREHLRLMARWASALGCEDAWPFFDVAAKVQPEARASAAEVTTLEQHLRSLHLPNRVVNACIWALHWDQVKALPEAARFALPDPFEPLLAMFEQGGRFTTEHGYVDLDGAAFRLGRLSDHLPESGAFVAPTSP